MRGHVPYRGDGKPNHFKSRRRFVNLKREKRETVFSILFIIMTFSFGVLSAIFSKPSNSDKTIDIAALIIGLILIVTLSAGILSLNRFRKGYDVDISDNSEKDNDHKKVEELENHIDL